MALGFLRVLFLLLSTTLGYQLGSAVQYGGASWELQGAGIGVVAALLVILIERSMEKLSLRGLSSVVFGLILALIISKFLSNAVDLIPTLDPLASGTIKLILLLILSYFGIVFSVRGRDEFNLIIPYVKFDRQDQKDAILILDTSAVIDGRILDLCQTKFIEGRLVLPRFVLKELHNVADSQDALKRARGRRGLDVLNKLKKIPQLSLKIDEEDFAGLDSVDDKLVKMAKLLGAKILTTDFNLNKVAEFQEVTILNINELAGSLRPVVLPGEILEVRLLKEGKEHNQAIGYLDDGTMVVVENARKYLGGLHKVSVSSVLQTASGRMIFGKLESA